MKKIEVNDGVSSEDIIDSLPAAVFTVDNSWRITSFNRGAERITGLSGVKVMGRLCHEVFQSTLCAENCPLRQTLADGKATLSGEAFIINAHGQQVPVTVSAALLRNSNQDVVGGVESLLDLRLLRAGTYSMEQAVQVCEAQTLIAALRRNNNNRAAAARELGIHKSTFFRKIKHLGIDLPRMDGRFRVNSHGPS